MYIAPRSRMGKWALGLALVVALFPLYWSVFMLIPDSMRGISISIAVLIPLVALTSLVLVRSGHLSPEGPVRLAHGDRRHHPPLGAGLRDRRVGGPALTAER